MKISLMLIGDELLRNKREDLNAHFVISKLKEKHLYLNKLLLVGDNEFSIKEGLLFLIAYSDVLITSGGLGLTPDDITLVTVAKTLEKSLVKDKTVQCYVLNSLKKIGQHANKNYIEKMSYSIDGAIPIKNEVGVSPGMHLKITNKHLLILPGVPQEFNAMLTRYVLPLLANGKTTFEKTFFVPLKESDLIEFLELLETKYKIKTASYPPIFKDSFLEIKLMGEKESVNKAVEYFKVFLKSKGIKLKEDNQKDL
ncbi:MAG: molybdopterin-binding protein [Caldisericota bacterium]|nr:molybdopterin-binding protein [Caldisericota bacterium]